MMKSLKRLLLLFCLIFSVSCGQKQEFYDGYWWTPSSNGKTCATIEWQKWDIGIWNKSMFATYAAYTLINQCQVISPYSEDEAKQLHTWVTDIDGTNLHQSIMTIYEHEKKHWSEGKIHPSN